MGDRMSYRKIFPKSALLVVIHVLYPSQVLKNVTIAINEGASGVFLIDHYGVPGRLSLIFDHVREHHDSIWIGLNYLGITPTDAIHKIPINASGLWTDDAGVTDCGGLDYSIAASNWDLRQKRDDWSGLYFGGVSFKYQKPIRDHRIVAQISCDYMDVITTSGDATGHPPKVEKIIEMRNAVSDFPLAIASGISADNIGQFLGIADCFLVSTSISENFYDLNPIKVRKLVQVMGI